MDFFALNTYGKFWIALLKHFIKYKTVISEELFENCSSTFLLHKKNASFLLFKKCIYWLNKSKKLRRKNYFPSFFVKLHYAIKNLKILFTLNISTKFANSKFHVRILTLEICIIQQILRFCKLHCVDLMR